MTHPILPYESKPAPTPFRPEQQHRWLPELLFILFAIIILIFLCTPRFSHGPETKRSATIAEIANITSILETYKIDTGNYPTTAEGLDALLTPSISVIQWKGPYLPKFPTDKWGHPYHYQFPDPANPSTFELTSDGRDGTVGTSDDITKATEK